MNAGAQHWVHDLSPFAVRFGEGWGIRWYGLAYVAAFVAGYYLYRWLARRGFSDVPEEKVADFIFWGALFGVLLGGRIGYAVLYDWENTVRDPLSIFLVHRGGMSSHGGMAGLVAFTFWFARRHRLSWTGIGDSLCAVAPVGLFFGRCANFINGELYGRVAAVPWAVKFPKELYDAPDLAAMALARASALGRGYGTLDAVIGGVGSDAALREALAALLPPRHPSQLYEAALEGLVLFAAVWFVRTRVRVPRGFVTGLFFLLYALLRIVGEAYREPEIVDFGMTRGQFLSLFLALAGAAFIVSAFVRRDFDPAWRRSA